METELRVPVQARSQRTRAELVEAARLEFGGRGYALTTAKSIAARAQVGTGTFYHYFPDKDALLREIAVERAAGLEGELMGHHVGLADAEDGAGLASALAALRRRVRKDVRAYVDYHRRDRGLHAVVSERRLCDTTLAGALTEIERRGAQRTAEALARWGFEGDCRAAAFMIFSLVDGAVHNHVLSPASPLSDTRFVDALVDAIMRIGASARMWGALERAK